MPTGDELMRTLTQLVIWPDLTCDDLRTAFDVEYLPLAETPEDVGLEYEEYWAPTTDNELINIWYLPAELDRGTVIISQGSTGTKPCYLFLARMILHKGWSVVMYDYRGFGASSGETDMSTLHVDLNAVMDWALEHLDRQEYTLWGVSLGSLPTMAVAVDRSEHVNGVILDSPVALGMEIQRFEFRYGGQTRDLIEMLPREMLAEELAADLTKPLLIFQSGLDTITPPASVQAFYDRAGGPKELIGFPSLGHATAPYHGTSSYSYYLERFLSVLWEQFEPLEVEIQAAP